jgi:hypothetical protein
VARLLLLLLLARPNLAGGGIAPVNAQLHSLFLFCFVSFLYGGHHAIDSFIFLASLIQLRLDDCRITTMSARRTFRLDGASAFINR